MVQTVAQYVRLLKELLELERDEEKRESVAAGDGNKLSSLEASGLAICRLSLQSVSSDVGGRQVVKLVTRGGRQLAPARISTGDLVAIREQKGREAISGQPGHSHASDGVVTALGDTSVEVACDEPLLDEGDHDSNFALTKITSDVTHKRYTASLTALEHSAEDPTHVAYALIQVLLGSSKPRFNRSIQIDERQNKLLNNLNNEQKEAVLNALKAKDLAVIHGPPGTGKTHTLIAFIMAEVLRGSRVLVVAPSNVAVDNITERLGNISSAPKFVRAGHPARIMPHVAKHSLEAMVSRTDEARLAQDIRYELSELDEKVGKTREKLKRRTLRMEQRDLRRELRRRERDAVKRLLSQMDIVLSTISGAGARVLDIAENSAPFDVVVIDEAAQALEAACWVALLRARKAILAGDPFQLAGTVKSSAAESRGLKKSILDRVFSTESLKATITMLKVQYRMNHVISTWSSEEFYNGELVPDASVANRRVIDLESFKKDAGGDEALTQPLIMIDTAGGDCEESMELQAFEGQLAAGVFGLEAHSSRFNEVEAEIVKNIVRQFVYCGMLPQNIAVISPYSGQVQLLRKHLWSAYGRSLEVATIDSFQGREKEIVCLSLVRSNEGGEVGFLQDDRRLNVAITRARRCVVVVCDSETVTAHPLLARLVEYAENFGHYRSAVVDFPEIVGTFSQLRRPKAAIEAERQSALERKRTKGNRALNTATPDEIDQRLPIAGKSSSSTGLSVPLRRSEAGEMHARLRREMEEFLEYSSDVLLFPAHLSSAERRIVHELAEEFGVNHQSVDTSGGRRIKVWKRFDAGGIGAQEVEEIGDAPTVEHLQSRQTLSEGNELVSTSGFTALAESGEETINTKLDTQPSTESVVSEPALGHFESVNSLLRDARMAREERMNAAATGRTPLASASSSGQPSNAPKRKGKGRNRANSRRQDSDDDFDEVLAKYGAQRNPPASGGLVGPVARIVDGKLTTAVPTPKNNDQARRKLSEKLSQQAAKRKKKPKK